MPWSTKLAADSTRGEVSGGDRSGNELLPDWALHLPDRPTVYTTLGTIVNHVPGVFAAILEGFRDEPINLILTIGRNQDPADFGPQPPNMHIERYVRFSCRRVGRVG